MHSMSSMGRARSRTANDSGRRNQVGGYENDGRNGASSNRHHDASSNRHHHGASSNRHHYGASSNRHHHGVTSNNGNGFASNNGNGFASNNGNGIPSNNGNGFASNNGNGFPSNNGNGFASNNGNGIASNNGNGVPSNRENPAGNLNGTGDQSLVVGGKKKYDSSMFAPTTKPSHISNKKGATGLPVQLYSNYFSLKCRQNWVLFQYCVAFSPQVDNLGVRKAMINQHKGVISQIFIFDGSMLFTNKRLAEKVTKLKSARKFDDAEIDITITLTNELAPDSKVSQQVYNIIFRRILSMVSMQQVGRNYYSPKDKKSVDCGRDGIFEIWPGFQTSILKHENSVMLCSQVSHKLMRKTNVLDAIKKLKYDKNGGGNRSFCERVERFLVGQVVLTRYNNKTYRIDGIEWKKRVTDSFEKGDGKKITYLDYFKQQHQVEIHDRNQPLLVSTPKKVAVRSRLPFVHLVPELCTLTGITDDIRNNFQVMKTLAQHTKQGPSRYAEAILNFVNLIQRTPASAELLRNWNFNFSNNLVSLHGRQLPPERIEFGRGTSVPLGPDASFDRFVKSSCLYKTEALDRWLVVYCKRDENVVRKTVDSMTKVSVQMNFRLSCPMVAHVNDPSLDSFHHTIKMLAKQNKNGFQLIFVFLPNASKDRYDSLKTLCCVELGIPSQFALVRTLMNDKRHLSVCSKIIIQMSVKLGGEAWKLSIPLKDTMIVGIDSYHDSACRGASVGAFVSSFNNSFTRWHSHPTFQGPSEELINSLGVCVIAALKNYQKYNNNCLPSSIFLYRDGVGDGQISHVKDHEIVQMQNAIEQYTGGKKINLTVIIVNKRIMSRFFKCDAGNRLNNPQPGTVVDDVITKPDRYDFFVVSQSVREGTVTPTYFNVIHDDCKIKTDHLQRLTYKLCHLYYNWPGTVRVPAPCVYAHKLAFLIGQSIHKPVSPSLSDKLYYL